jgi:hypothetical protein
MAGNALACPIVLLCQFDTPVAECNLRLVSVEHTTNIFATWHETCHNGHTLKWADMENGMQIETISDNERARLAMIADLQWRRIDLEDWIRSTYCNMSAYEQEQMQKKLFGDQS